MNILILEDDQWFAASLGRTLAVHGYDTKIVNDPGRVFELLNQAKYEAIIMDVHLGRFNAITLLNEMATYDDTLALPKIILSASGHDIALGDVRQFGVIAVLDKATYQMDDILNALPQRKLTSTGIIGKLKKRDN